MNICVQKYRYLEIPHDIRSINNEIEPHRESVNVKNLRIGIDANCTYFGREVQAKCLCLSSKEKKDWGATARESQFVQLKY